MTNIQAALKNFLLTDAAISSITGLRISFDDLPPGAYPAVCIWCLSERPGLLLNGERGVTESSYRLDCYAEKGAEVWTIKEAIKDRLHGFKGVIYDANGEPVNIKLAMLDDARSLAFMDKNKVFGWELEFTITWQAA